MSGGQARGRRGRTGSSGFTLVEMLVVAGLLVTVITLAFGGIRQYNLLLSKLRMAQEELDQARYFSALRQSIRSLYPFVHPTRGVAFPQGNKRFRHLFEGEPRRMRYATLTPLFHPPTGEPFFVELDGREERLRVRERPVYDRASDYHPDVAMSDAPEHLLPAGWRLHRLEYWDGRRWTSTMRTATPRGIRMIMTNTGQEERWTFAIDADDDRRWRAAVRMLEHES